MLFTDTRKINLDLVLGRGPMLACFVNELYGGEFSFLVFGNHVLRREEGTQQSVPASMLLFYVVVHPLLRRFPQETGLDLNEWFADDGDLMSLYCTVILALD